MKDATTIPHYRYVTFITRKARYCKQNVSTGAGVTSLTSLSRATRAFVNFTELDIKTRNNTIGVHFRLIKQILGVRAIVYG